MSNITLNGAPLAAGLTVDEMTARIMRHAERHAMYNPVDCRCDATFSGELGIQVRDAIMAKVHAIPGCFSAAAEVGDPSAPKLRTLLRWSTPVQPGGGVPTYRYDDEWRPIRSYLVLTEA